MGIQDNMQPFEDYVDPPRGEYEGWPLENGENSCETVLPKFKPPKMYGIRDFPDGCGPNAAHIDAIVSSSEKIAEKFSREADNYIEDSVTDTEFHSPQVAQGSHQTQVAKTSIRMDSDNDESVVLVNMVDGVALKNETLEGNKMKLGHDNAVLGRKLGGSELDMNLDNAGLVDVPMQLEDEAVTNNTTLNEDIIQPGGAKLTLLPSQALSKSNTTLTRKFPPRRNVSAIRDFPAFCGREAKRPTKDEYIRMGLGHLHEEMLAKDSEATKSEEHEGSTMQIFDKNTYIDRGDKVTACVHTIKAPFPRDAYHLNRKPQPYGKKTDIEERAAVKVRKETDAYRYKFEKSDGKMSSDTVVHNKQDRGVPHNLGNKVMLHQKSVQKYYSDQLGGKSLGKKSVPIQKPAHHKRKLVVRDAVDFEEANEEPENLHVAQRSDDFKVNVAPLVRRSSIWQGSKCYSIGTRNKVREILRYFQVVFRKLLQEDEAASKKGQPRLRRVDLAAAKIVKGRCKYVNIGESILGTVPGVEVGDEFRYRVELAMVGLHRPPQAGIDYVRKGTKIFATSVVASGAYADDLGESDVLIYMGAGGNIATGYKKEFKPEDQKLERGNLAMKNSADAKSPVRVIRGFKEMKTSDASDRSKLVSTFTYDGLYMVDDYWQEQGPHGKLFFQFKLVRMSGQPELTWNEVNKSKKNKVREGVCVKDISLGKELFSVCVINTINKEVPPQFKYITSIIKPKWYNPAPPRGCGCKGGCVDSAECSCAAKNGSLIPYNHNGCIVEVKQLVYECGPACRCPPSCYNRVSQHGPTFQLEIFKTETKGWGVRSLYSIPSGSFICEYLGQILNDKEAELKISRDEYLFDIGQNYKDLKLDDGSSDDSEDCGFTIDGEEYGNVGRFINHSCSPNLYAQSVLYDHEDKRMPHIMLFAAENIPPLKELTYHYNYKIDHVYDSDGNIKKKSCHCGSTECMGRMY